ncbi:MAG: DNA helicase RecQ [Rhodospirillaceae bacterium]|nr:DNA helicase RecQ [Rhodospirillaceae bacterium]
MSSISPSSTSLNSTSQDSIYQGSLSRARHVLKDVFGYDEFRFGQEPVIAALLAGEHALAVMPTGAGKSLCYQIPALVFEGLTVVVSPLVALMTDQVAALKLAGVEAETINSSRAYEDNADSWRRVAGGQTRILYIAPERLMTGRMLSALKRLPMKLIAVDEAHCISRWGPAFRPDYEALRELGEHFPGVPIAAMTATADAATREDITAKLFGGRGQSVVTGFDRPNIQLGVEMRANGKQQLLSFLKDHEDENGIVYCLSRKKTEETAAYLRAEGIRALPYHAGMNDLDRTNHQGAFMTEAGTVIVATIAFGMGIDKPDVRFVFHADLPGTMEAYYQEIGRAGRDGLPAVAHMLYGLDDIRMRRMFIDQEDSADDHKRREHKRLDTLIAFCEAPSCRRQMLLDYFGETTQPCGNCDLCTNPPDLTDGSDAGRLVLGVVNDTGQRFGAVHLIDVLRGGDTERIRSFGHDRLAGYGAGKDMDKNAWRSMIRQMVAAGFLQLDVKGFGGLSITEKGAALGHGDEEFRYRADTVHRQSAAKSRKKTPAAASDLSTADTDLFSVLKAHRLALAKKKGVPAYAVFPDKTLAEMARHRPATTVAFAEIHGVGQAKLEKFADSFLDVISTFTETE